MDNKRIAEIFEEIADMLSIEETPTSIFEVRAYRKAALTVGTLQEPIEDLYKRGGTKALMLPGIGKGLASKIEEFIKTGKISKYEDLKKKYPINFNELTQIPGLGAKRIVLLYKALGISDLKSLQQAVDSHKISTLPSFGTKSEALIKKGMMQQAASQGRMLLGDALPIAESIVRELMQSGTVTKAVVAGSARRMRETVGDLDILALSDNSQKAIDFFTQTASVKDIVVKGPTKATVILKAGLNCDLRVVKPESFGAALQYFTGSKDHGVQVRQIAVRKGYSLNEYGLTDKKGKVISSKTEEEIYNKLGLQYVPPEMREARGEVKLSQYGKIPNLVELEDLRGDFHTHTKETDGANTLEEMADAAIKAGLEYFATTNHTQSLKIANGMSDNGFKKFFMRVDQLNKKLEDKITILKGAECDILKNGTLDLEKSTLKSMDCVVGAIHSAFSMEEAEMTNRIIKALDSGLVHILAHPTGRIIHGREAYKVNLEKVYEAAERNNVALEIDSFPDRLDLNDVNILNASKHKIMFAIDSDGHRTSHFSFLRYGVGTARRGWLTKNKVLNSLNAKDLAKKLAR